MTSVTDADREIAGQVLGEYILGNDERANKIIATYRQAAMIEGARLMQEAAVKRLREHCATVYWADVSTLDPEAIVKGKSDE